MNSPLYQLFEAQVQQTPDSVAVVFRDELLTYAELDSRANQLAHYLKKLGVGPELLVGICADRGIETLVGILAVLKAGGAYLPLDPEYPEDRLSFMLLDAAVTVLLTQDKLMELISSLNLGAYTPQVVCLDTDWLSISAESTTALGELAVSDNLVYVIYTSGSTGEPKGVQIEHRGLCNMAEAQVQAFSLQPDDRVLQFSSLSFDASVFEIFMALRVGATLVIVPPESRVPGPALTQLLLEQDISVVVLPPSVLAALTADDLPKLKIITVAGEACSAELVDRWAHGRLFYNLYGPTEATVWATIAKCVDGCQKPSIGQAILNTEVYLLDQDLQPVPPGEPGELHIAGAGLARGYLSRPQLNAEKFIPDPFQRDSGVRMYKTGDIGRRLPDGNIEFIGRKDDQVKLRGFRIELGEVEAALRSRIGVRDAVVNLKQGVNDAQQLVAHVVIDTVEWQQQVSSHIAALREYLERKLPHYMVPAAFVLMESLPLTIQGKVDRRALPEPDADRSQLSSDYQAPRNQVEEKLAAIWADVLGLEQVGVKDQFLELGGHSLLATRIVTRIREELDIDLLLADFYKELNVAGLATRIKRVSPATHSKDTAVIYPASRDAPLPVSFPQEQVIFLTQLTPDSLAYNAQASIHFAGKLDTLALERALNEIVRRHEIFRTSFEIVEGRPTQRIHSDCVVQLPVVDLSSIPKEQRGERKEAVIDEEIQQRFNLSEIPLVRWKLLKLSADEHLLIHVEHHLVHDGWSFGVFIHELQVLYRAYSNGRDSPLPELPIQFADYVVWQRQWLQGETLQTLLHYWKQKLAGSLPVLPLPTDYPRPPVQSHRGAEEVVDLSPELADQLRELSQSENSSLFVATLTVFFVLLHRYSSQQDIVVGTGVANRNCREVEGLIGMFINTIALRADLSGDPTFRELVQRIHEMAFEAYAYQELPFEKLVEELPIDRDLAYNPVFQVLFGFHDAQVPVLQFSDLTGKINYLHNGSAKFDLNLVVIPWAEQHTGLEGEVQDRRLTMKWEYATDLFTPDTIRGMALHYQNLAQELIRNPDKRLSELSMLSESERRQLIEDWNRTSTDYPADKTVHELFESQAAATPDAIAVEYEGTALSYAELNQRANQLAHYLQARGVGSEVMVGLYMERSLEMIVALLGILKAGGAYVPLDPDYPRPRLAFMLEDASVPVLLSMSTLAERLPDFTGERVCLDTDWATIGRESSQNPVSGATADNLIYVIYTSGSTGLPKGTLIEHRSVVRLVKQTNYVELGPAEVFLQFAPISFDASTFELWGSLLNGGKLVVFPPGRSALDELGQFIQENGITTLWLTSALFSQMVDNHMSSLSGVQQLLAGGEVLPLQQVKKMLKHLDGGCLINGYGPTENTTFTCCNVMTGATRLEQSVPIGRPVSNTTVYILDQQMRPVPVGVHGELYIGGDGLARGYLNQPELTAEKFVANPFSDRAGERLYRTGDKVRYRRDGSIEFLGRFDHQLKIRGYRIEPGEIETLLTQYETVRDAVVNVHEDETGDKQLVAYVVPEHSAVPAAAELRTYVRERLPDYMLPSVFILLDELPLTAVGKLDRCALPAPGSVRDSVEVEYSPPRTKLEQQLTQIWAEILKLERPGIYDDFFDLGGHSLLAGQVMNRLRDIVGLEIPMRCLFENPTVARLAEYVEAAMWRTDQNTAGDGSADHEQGAI